MAIPASYPRPTPRTPARPARPTLRLIRPPAPQKSWLGFVALCLGIFIASMLGALVLNTVMASASYDIHNTELELLRVQQANQQLSTQVEQLGSPAELARRATSLGMVPGEGVSYLNLADGLVLGPDGGTN